MGRIFPAVLWGMLIIVTISLSAEESDVNASEQGHMEASGSRAIKEIRIVGADRSKESMILRVAGIAPGDPWTDESASGVRQNLLKENLFIRDSLQVVAVDQGNDVIVEIHLEEKWSLIPLPLVVFSGDSFSAGFFLLESNFLGYGIRLNSGGFCSRDGLMGMIGLGTDNFAFSLGYGTSEKSDLSLEGYEEHKVRSYVMRTPTVSFTPQLERGALTFSLPLGFRNISIDEAESTGGIALPESDAYWDAGLGVAYENYGFDRYFKSGANASFSGNLINLNDYFFTAAAGFSRPFGSVRLAGTVDFLWGELPVSRYFSPGGKEGSRTLPRDLSTDAYIASNLTAEKIFIDGEIIDFSGALFYEAGAFDDISGEALFYHGPGAGVFLYFDKLVFPALSLTTAWSVPLEELSFSFSFGISF